MTTLRRGSIGSRALLAALLAGLAVVTTASAVAAPTPTPPADVPTASSVSLLPRDVDPNAPHNGTWFVLTVEPGRSASAAATLANPSDRDLLVSLSLEGLSFDVDGQPTLDGPEGVGTWGTFSQREVLVEAGTTEAVEFSLTVPSGTEPGDHLGAAVARTRQQADTADLVTEVATRVIVTVPGDADRAFELDRVTVERRPGPIPAGVLVRVQLRNTGSIRIAPTVTVAGITAQGSDVVVRDSVEEYVAEVPSSPLGGWLRLPVIADDVSGVTRRTETGILLVPWWLLALLGGVVTATVLHRRRRGAGSELAALHADVRRLERLVLERVREDDTAAGNGHLDRDPTYAIESALKRARRAEEYEAFEELALAFHASGRDALGYVLEALGNRPARPDELLDAAASYGRRALLSNQARALPDDLRAALEERLAQDARGTGRS